MQDQAPVDIDGASRLRVPDVQAAALLSEEEVLQYVPDLVTAAGTGDIVIYDRALDLTNAGAPDGGMIVRLPLELFTGAAAVAHASTLAVDDAYTVAEGVVGHSEPLGTGVLANDDGSITGAVQIVGVGAFASDAGGTVTLASDGSFAYDAPAGDFTGEDSWQYLGTPGGNVATVTIDVTNTPDAPVALDDARSVFEGEAVNVGVLGNDHDPDGDALTVTLTAPLVAGVVVNAADQSVSFTAPGASFSFTYEVSDGALTSGMATVSIDVTAAGGPTLSVVDGGTGVAIAGGFRWVVEEDVGFHPVPNVRDLDILSFNFHKSYMPVVASGEGAALPTLDYGTVTDPRHYYVSVLPNDGYEMGGAPIAPGATAVEVFVQPVPQPTAQIIVFVFEDTLPVNGQSDLPEELGLEGFHVFIDEPAGSYGHAGGKVTMDAYTNPIGTTYCDATNTGTGQDCDGKAIGEVNVLGDTFVVTDANGRANIKNLPPGKYGVIVTPPAGDPGLWHQTSTIEGSKVQDAWVKQNEPPFLRGVRTSGISRFRRLREGDTA